MLSFCISCVNPKGIGVINPTNGKELGFQETENGVICDICNEILNSGFFPSREEFNAEFEKFLQTQKKVLFAYSGGLDSTVVLFKLLAECRRRGLELILFTVNTTVKGKVAENNIENVLRYLRIKRNHFYVDITHKFQDNPKIISALGSPMETLGVYRKCLIEGILPCGAICNAMMDREYESVMNKLGFDILITGGDTPKRSAAGIYSLFWDKPSGITIVRGGFAFAMAKASNAAFIKEQAIPWQHPHCGGYDTDCLIPGVFFAEGLNHKPDQTVEAVVAKYPIILDYLSERVRFGVIDRNEGLRMLAQVDISSSESYEELMEILR